MEATEVQTFKRTILKLNISVFSDGFHIDEHHNTLFQVPNKAKVL